MPKIPYQEAKTQTYGLRIGLRLTQAEAAALFGVTPNTWARWERGEMNPHPAHAKRLNNAIERMSKVIKSNDGPALWYLETALTQLRSRLRYEQNSRIRKQLRPKLALALAQKLQERERS